MTSVDPSWLMPEELWQRMAPLIPPEPPKARGGRPRMDDRQAANGIWYVLRTGCQWKALPRALGAASTVHRRFLEWQEAGVFTKLWQQSLVTYDEERGLELAWQSMDGAMTKAPLGGEKNRAESDRSWQIRREAQFAY